MVDIYVPIAVLAALMTFLVFWRFKCHPGEGDTMLAVARMMSQDLNPPQAVQAPDEPKELSKEIIDSYPRIVIIGENGRMLQHDDNTCPICLTEYLTKDTLKILPECLHRFHSDCLDEWLSINATCPVCLVHPPTIAPDNQIN